MPRQVRIDSQGPPTKNRMEGMAIHHRAPEHLRMCSDGALGWDRRTGFIIQSDGIPSSFSTTFPASLWKAKSTWAHRRWSI